MDYSTVLLKFRSCMTDIGNALRKVNGTTKKYKFTEIASAINECTQVYYLGTGTSFNVSNIPDYQNLTVDDFLVCAKSLSTSISVEGEGHSSASSSSGSTISKSYNANTGVFSVSGNSVYVSASHSSGNCWGASSTSLAVDVYLVKGNIKQL